MIHGRHPGDTPPDDPAASSSIALFFLISLPSRRLRILSPGTERPSAVGIAVILITHFTLEEEMSYRGAVVHTLSLSLDAEYG